MFDAYGNHISQGLEVQLEMEGLHLQDRIGLKRKVSFVLVLWHVI